MRRPAKSAWHRASLSRSRQIVTLVTLGLLTGLGPFTIDLYLPAFPQLREDFGVADGQVQLTLAATTLGFALGQLVVGPLSDRIGRRIPLLAANSVHVLASLGVAMAPDIEVLSLLRILQGLGAAGGAVVAMAMVRDLFSGDRLIVALSRLMLVQGAAPVVAPIVGSLLLSVVEWRGIFVVLAGYGLLMIVLQALILRETHPRGRGFGTAEPFFTRYRRVLSDRVYVGILLLAFATWGGLFSYLASASLLLQGVYGFTELQFGAVFAVCAIGVVSGSQVSPLISTRHGPPVTLMLGTAYLLLMGILMLSVALLDAHVVVIIVALFLYEFGVGLVNPAVQAIGLGRHGRDAGTAASLIGATGMLGAALVGPVIGMFPVTSAVPMASAVAISAVVGVIVLWSVVRPRSIAPLPTGDARTDELPVRGRG